jgi:outer membrane lipase/esterase
MKSKVNGIVRAMLGVGALASALLLASCGGSGTPVQVFVATRVIAFGDETSVITDAHKKYSVNALVTGSTTEVECSLNPIWIQLVAGQYGLVFPQCPGLFVDPVSRIRATVGARVADLAAQIDQQINLEGGFRQGDLVTVLVGANDIVALFEQYPGVGLSQLESSAETYGLQLAAQVNRLADAGAKVLISTIPNMGLTPYAGDRSAGTTNGNPAVLAALSKAFNDALLARITNDGHRIGLIQLDEYLVSLDNARAQGTGSYSNTTLPSCTAPLPDCTVLTQVPEAITSAWLWADDLHLGAFGQTSLGSLAASRASANPF